MATSRILVIVSLFLTCSAIGVAGAIEKPDAVEVEGKISWVYDYEEGKRLSKATDKPMFVVFRCER